MFAKGILATLMAEMYRYAEKMCELVKSEMNSRHEFLNPMRDTSTININSTLYSSPIVVPGIKNPVHIVNYVLT